MSDPCLPPTDVIPAYPPFDTFWLGPCENLSSLILYSVVTAEPGAQWIYGIPEDAIHMWSGVSTGVDSEVFIQIDTNITNEFTVEWQIKFDSLPPDFTSVTSKHIYAGAGSAQGYICGLMFSRAGVAFVPCPGTTSVTAIPGSLGLVEEGETYVIRMVAASTGTYIYVTPYATWLESGHVLCYVMDSVVTAERCPSIGFDLAWLSVQGVFADSDPSDIWLKDFALSSQLLFADFPPTAVAGRDQAAQFCSIVQLDGSESSDVNGRLLQYAWRLLDAPVGSGFVLDGLIGASYPLPVPVGYTNKWYCADLEHVPSAQISPGDVLLVDGIPYDIELVDLDGLHGWYVQITSVAIPDSLSSRAFKVLAQFGLSDATVGKPTFYPDIPGFYKFDLKVFSTAWSLPSVTVVNVLASAIARGCTPDMKFIWEYLSDFWKLVDDKQRYEVVWSGLAQFASSELLNLWQYEYSKSLRDVQRTFQRRWRSYDLRYLPIRADSSFRLLYSPYDSSVFVVGPLSGLVGESVIVSLPDSTRISVTFYTPVGGGTTLLPSEAVAQLTKLLPSTFTASLVSVDSTHAFIRVIATHAFSVASSSASIFGAMDTVGTISGSQGHAIRDGYAFQVDGGVSLSGLGIVENDFLEVGGEMYRIVQVQSSGTGPTGNVVTLKDKMPERVVDSWSVPSYVTQAYADFYNQLVSDGDLAVVEIRDIYGRSGYRRVRVFGASSSKPEVLGIDPEDLDLYIFAGSAVYTLSFISVFRRTYTPISPLIVDIPHLQETLTAAPEANMLRRNLDYFLDTFRGQRCIRFDTRIWVHEEGGVLVDDIYPPVALWAEVTHLDNRPAIEGNFGIPAGFTLENLSQLSAEVDYLSAVRGLWYSQLNGPRLSILRVGAQILLGLPFAEEDGTIEEIRTDYSPNTARMLIRDTMATQVVRSYVYKKGLELEINPSTGVAYAVGDSITQFSPLVKGVELIDYVSDKKWADAYIDQGSLSQLHKFFRFLVRVDYGAFSLAAIAFVRDFILKVKPTYTYPIFSVLFPAEDSIDISDDVEFTVAYGFFDSITLSEEWLARLRITRSGPFMPKHDSIFAWDLPVYDIADPGTPIVWHYDRMLPGGTTYFRDILL